MDYRDRLADGLVLAKNIIQALADKGINSIPIPTGGLSKVSKDKELLPVTGANLAGEVSTQAGVSIKIACLPWNGYYHRGKLQRYSSSEAIIHVAEVCNPCWSRFVIAKELFHILLGNEANYSQDMTILINGLLNVGAFPLDRGLEAEDLAVFGALALLIPPSESSNIQKLKNQGDTDYQIASYYSVPEKIVPLRLTNWLITEFDKFT